MNKPIVSIIMPVYNGGEFLVEAIESILNQSYKNFEFIIFDDGSTDDSFLIIKKYAKKDKRIRLIKKNKNKGFMGYVKNLNEGLKLAKGKYVARMDADDISLPNRLEKQVDFLEKNSDIFLVGGGRLLINERGRFIGIRFGIIGFNRIKKILEKAVCIVHPSIMFRNEKKIFYREKMFYSEDYDFYLRAISQGKKLNNIFVPLIKYRFKEKSISRSNSYSQQLFTKKCIDFFLEQKKYFKDSYSKFNPDKLKKMAESKKVSSFDEIESNFISSNYLFCEELCLKYFKRDFNIKIFIYYILSKFKILAYVSKQIVHLIKILYWIIFY